METFQIHKDIRTFYVQASSFPSGVLEAHQKLHGLVGDPKGRNYFGISWGQPDGGILYRAAVEESYEGEAKEMGCEIFVIPKGDYLAEMVTDYMKDPSKIGKVFQQMLVAPDLDPNGFCLEMYLTDTEVRCLVKLVNENVTL